MPKVKVTELTDDLPEMPGDDSEQNGVGGSPSPSTSSGSEPGVEVVDEGLAGDLIALPFEAWAVFETRVPKEAIVLSQKQKDFLAGPVSRVLTKYGLGKIAKDEVVIVAVLSMHTFGIVNALSKAKKEGREIPAQA